MPMVSFLVRKMPCNSFLKVDLGASGIHIKPFWEEKYSETTDLNLFFPGDLYNEMVNATFHVY